MISFRFHIVSITAIFLALSIGIAMGATVVDRATVDVLENQLGRVEQRSNAVAAANDLLRRDSALTEDYAGAASEELIPGRLAGVPVVIFGLRGTSTESVRALRGSLATAGATFLGTVWLTPRWALQSRDDVAALAAAAGTAVARTELVRQTGFDAVARRIEDPVGLVNPLPGLRDAGFLEYEPTGSGGADLTTFPAVVPPSPPVVVVVAGDDGVSVPDTILGLPLVRALAPRAPVLVADLTVASAAKRGVGVAPLAAAVRSQPPGGGVSTVDGGSEARGRAAAVLAVAELAKGRSGHYGRGPRAQRQLPDSTP